MASAEPILRGAITNELWVAARYGQELTELIMRAAGVDPDEYGPLSFIGFLQPVTRTRLAEATGLRRTTLRDMVSRLIERGDVEERPNPRDGRSTSISLTPAGQAIFDRGAPCSGASSRESTTASAGSSASTRRPSAAYGSRCRGRATS